MIPINRTATIIAFRARDDITRFDRAVDIRCRVTTFRGTVLGTTGDGYDVIAAFNSEADARRFLDRYLEGDLDGPIGTYVITEATI